MERSLAKQLILSEYFIRTKEAEDKRDYETSAAVRVQKLYRGYLARKHLRILHLNAIRIQAYYRGHLATKIYKKLLAEQCKLEREQFRGWYIRKYAADIKERRRYLRNVEAKNDEIRRMQNEYREQQIRLAQEQAEEKHINSVIAASRGLHHIVSTKTQPSIFKSPYSLTQPTVCGGIPVENFIRQQREESLEVDKTRRLRQVIPVHGTECTMAVTLERSIQQLNQVLDPRELTLEAVEEQIKHCATMREGFRNTVHKLESIGPLIDDLNRASLKRKYEIVRCDIENQCAKIHHQLTYLPKPNLVALAEDVLTLCVQSQKINETFPGTNLAKESKLWLAELADRVRVLLVNMFLEIVNIKNYPKQAISQSIYPSKTVTAVELREKEKQKLRRMREPEELLGVNENDEVNDNNNDSSILKKEEEENVLNRLYPLKEDARSKIKVHSPVLVQNEPFGVDNLRQRQGIVDKEQNEKDKLLKDNQPSNINIKKEDTNDVNQALLSSNDDANAQITTQQDSSNKQETETDEQLDEEIQEEQGEYVIGLLRRVGLLLIQLQLAVPSDVNSKACYLQLQQMNTIGNKDHQMHLNDTHGRSGKYQSSSVVGAGSITRPHYRYFTSAYLRHLERSRQTTIVSENADYPFFTHQLDQNDEYDEYNQEQDSNLLSSPDYKSSRFQSLDSTILSTGSQYDSEIDAENAASIGTVGVPPQINYNSDKLAGSNSLKYRNGQLLMPQSSPKFNSNFDSFRRSRIANIKQQQQDTYKLPWEYFSSIDLPIPLFLLAEPIVKRIDYHFCARISTPPQQTNQTQPIPVKSESGMNSDNYSSRTMPPQFSKDKQAIMNPFDNQLSDRQIDTVQAQKEGSQQQSKQYINSQTNPPTYQREHPDRMLDFVVELLKKHRAYFMGEVTEMLRIANWPNKDAWSLLLGVVLSPVRTRLAGDLTSILVEQSVEPFFTLVSEREKMLQVERDKLKLKEKIKETPLKKKQYTQDQDIKDEESNLPFQLGPHILSISRGNQPPPRDMQLLLETSYMSIEWKDSLPKYIITQLLKINMHMMNFEFALQQKLSGGVPCFTQATYTPVKRRYEKIDIADQPFYQQLGLISSTQQSSSSTTQSIPSTQNDQPSKLQSQTSFTIPQPEEGSTSSSNVTIELPPFYPSPSQLSLMSIWTDSNPLFHIWLRIQKHTAFQREAELISDKDQWSLASDPFIDPFHAPKFVYLYHLLLDALLMHCKSLPHLEAARIFALNVVIPLNQHMLYNLSSFDKYIKFEYRESNTGYSQTQGDITSGIGGGVGKAASFASQAISILIGAHGGLESPLAMQAIQNVIGFNQTNSIPGNIENLVNLRGSVNYSQQQSPLQELIISIGNGFNEQNFFSTSSLSSYAYSSQSQYSLNGPSFSNPYHIPRQAVLFMNACAMLIDMFDKLGNDMYLIKLKTYMERKKEAEEEERKKLQHQRRGSVQTGSKQKKQTISAQLQQSNQRNSLSLENMVSLGKNTNIFDNITSMQDLFNEDDANDKFDFWAEFDGEDEDEEQEDEDEDLFMRSSSPDKGMKYSSLGKKRNKNNKLQPNIKVHPKILMSASTNNEQKNVLYDEQNKEIEIKEVPNLFQEEIKKLANRLSNAQNQMRHFIKEKFQKDLESYIGRTNQFLISSSTNISQRSTTYDLSLALSRLSGTLAMLRGLLTESCLRPLWISIAASIDELFYASIMKNDSIFFSMEGAMQLDTDCSSLFSTLRPFTRHPDGFFPIVRSALRVLCLSSDTVKRILQPGSSTAKDFIDDNVLTDADVRKLLKKRN
ncbi:MAG: hypothetical protein EZS28_011158 [Streblomastix strix]|uniref:Uncharacterized protein n=1 Tax=Streblomastix strix TaxID=222440 RepID=A0A5J4WF26_9EUKA|nr:MAG: hypothetical protein EZS28_011158 [Streblomastix strix]